MKRTTFFNAKQVRRSCNASVVVIGLLSTFLSARPAYAQKPSDYAGRYSGEWVASMAIDDDHTGTWTISIADSYDEFLHTRCTQGCCRRLLNEPREY